MLPSDATPNQETLTELESLLCRLHDEDCPDKEITSAHNALSDSKCRNTYVKGRVTLAMKKRSRIQSETRRAQNTVPTADITGARSEPH